ncbi:MAG: methionine--tRNA ligase [Clostridia bacterium]
MKTFYVTTPIYYPSDKLHIGHSYTTVAADAMSRYKRIRGYDVMFVTGTDEHGQKIQRIAEENGMPPQEYVDAIVEGIIDLWKLMDISYDVFIRTTDERHVQTVQKIFKKLYDQGDIYKGHYEGWYCTPCESFWTQTQLHDQKCPDCNREVELTKEEAYFFKLSNYQERLIEHIEKNPAFIQPVSRKNEMLNNFLIPGLEDLCVSRTTFTWGVPVEFDPGHVVYVWIDALSNYISALGYLQDSDANFKKYWPADIHLVGKEIVRFHTIIWPIMLMALGLELPGQVYGHGWLVLGEGKMSKSKGNVIDPVVLVNRYGLDAIRYFLLREVPFGSDGVFSNDALVKRINSDLANDLGNLVSRTVAMVMKYFNGSIPADRMQTLEDKDLQSMMVDVAVKTEELLDGMQFNIALQEIWKGISRTNKYIDETMPWVLAREKENEPRLAAVMYNLAESIRIVSILLQPFMTQTPGKIWEQLGIGKRPDALGWESTHSFGGYPTDVVMQKGETLFPRIETEEQKQNTLEKEDRDTITYEDFSKIKFKTAVILSAEKVEGAEKLLKLMVGLGDEKRQIVSGIAKHYTPESLVGKTIVLVANLKPAKIRGIESDGMLLAASDEKELALVILDKEIPPGIQVK